ncbi:MAG: hypothetical protein U5N26_11550 [Candidatus Marinimicrobia bacterium]|nr:hypothetical protein [Candidatus Neomarinimicrobiota bacterium]
MEAELAIVNKEKEKADSDLITADKEVDFLRREKEKLEVELKRQLSY